MLASQGRSDDYPLSRAPQRSIPVTTLIDGHNLGQVDAEPKRSEMML